MQKTSRRAMRMMRHHKRNKSTAKLNIVSLMDIFTILLFFLLINASTEAEILTTPKQVTVPESITDGKPKENILIIISKTDITVDSKVVADIASLQSNREQLIPGILTSLQVQLNIAAKRKIDEKEFRKRGITIMSDKGVPYDIIKRVMLSCASMDFTNISLAVMQKEEKG